MTDSDRLLTPNRDEVVSKVIDGEAILINLSSGVYYSMDKVAALVWELIDREVAVGQIIDEVAARYEVTPGQAAADVEKLAAQLVEEKLVSETRRVTDMPGGVRDVPGGTTDMPGGITDMPGGITDMPGGITDMPGGMSLRYESPVLNIYRDMGDLLALDPPQPGLENTPWRPAGDDSQDAARA